jgi:hypothetical protein
MSQSNHTTQPVYTVNAFYDGNFMFQTDCSHNKEDMEEVLQNCTTMDPSLLEFRIFKSEPQGELYYNECFNLELDRMTLEVYKGGLLLRPSEDDWRQGEKYFMGGWWIEKHDAWFFKMSELNTLVELGAEYISDVVLVDNQDVVVDTETYTVTDGESSVYSTDSEEMSTEDDSVYSDEEVDLTSLDITSHGKGYLVRAPKDHQDYGKKYYGNGWWMESHEGWFFKKEHYDELIHHGAVEYSSALLEWVVEYGRGFLLKPLKSHPQYGSKYYRNGWWMESQEGWFFKKEHVDTETMTVM